MLAAAAGDPDPITVSKTPSYECLSKAAVFWALPTCHIISFYQWWGRQHSPLFYQGDSERFSKFSRVTRRELEARSL